MRHQIMHHMGVVLENERKAIEEQLAAVVEGFDFAGIIRSEAVRALDEGLRQAVKYAVTRAFADPEISKALDAMAIAQLRMILVGIAGHD